MFKYSADKKPVFIILLFSFVDFIAFFYLETLWVLVAYWFIMMIPKGLISAWNHHHQHSHVFKNNALNRILEFFYALHTGVTTNLWVLHHNLGHHRNFLDQRIDESRWKRKDGSTMGMIEYTLNVVLTAYPRGFRVGNRYPKLQKQFVIYTVITFSIVAALTVYNPLNAFFIFILPMIVSLIYTAWATYGHHTGLDTDDQFAGSHNIMNKWFNILTGNLGYHTAHHFKQGVHWSKLPELHETIKDKIPKSCFQKSFFDVFIRIKEDKKHETQSES